MVTASNKSPGLPLLVRGLVASHHLHGRDRSSPPRPLSPSPSSHRSIFSTSRHVVSCRVMPTPYPGRTPCLPRPLLCIVPLGGTSYFISGTVSSLIISIVMVLHRHRNGQHHRCRRYHHHHHSQIVLLT